MTAAPPSPLLETKFHVPRRRRELVRRPRLVDRLARAEGTALTVVAAPAGFGKTTVLTEWLAFRRSDLGVTAWLSLDARDNDPTLFWTYVIAALETVLPGVGAGAAARLSSHSALEPALATLLNDLGTMKTDTVLVLDDYHVIETTEIHEAVLFLVDHLPPELRLVVASRADPPLPLGRMRANGELVEVRSADLRFTPEEAASYLGEVMGLGVSTEDVAALETRTEGWIAALQLAALSMQGRDDIAAFIAGFAGDDRFIVDYLVGEVLQRQSDEVRTFLLATSILDRLVGSLCDALTGRADGTATLERLDHANLFVVPLDDQRRWYRYHHLFAEMLRARLLDEEPDQVEALHRRAADWYEANGERSEAIGHAIAAEDWDRTADLVELALPTVQQGRQEDTLRRWSNVLPEALFPTRPVLSVGLVGSLLSRGDLAGAEARLQDAERWVSPMEEAGRPDASPTVLDEDAYRALPGTIAMYRAGLARVSGDLEGTIRHARRALDVADEGAHADRGGAACLLGLTAWASGDLDSAHRWYGTGIASLDRAGYRTNVVGGAITLADIRVAQGRLREAMAHYDLGLAQATREGAAFEPSAADMHIGMSTLFLERNDLGAAKEHLLAGSVLADPTAFSQHAHRRPVAEAAILAAEGDLRGALLHLDDAAGVHADDFSPNVRPIAASQARVHLALGDTDEARRWADQQRLTPDDELSYLHEFEHLTLARILLAETAGSGAGLDVVSRFLERLLAAAEAGGRRGSEIEVLILQAIALQRRHQVATAIDTIERAMVSAEPEGYVRIFLDEGAALAPLLRAAAQRGGAASPASRLLAAAAAPIAAVTGRGALVDALSERELDVLRLLRSDLNGPEIARELMVSLNTVRTHTKSIYSKLAVNNRRSAIRRADELRL